MDVLLGRNPNRTHQSYRLPTPPFLCDGEPILPASLLYKFQMLIVFYVYEGLADGDPARRYKVALCRHSQGDPCAVDYRTVDGE